MLVGRRGAIIEFHLNNALEGYRRLTFMMIDQDVVAVSPSSVCRVLGQAGLLAKWNGKELALKAVEAAGESLVVGQA